MPRIPTRPSRTLATRLGVAVGTVNWYLKRLVAKGYIKVKRAERRKLRYILTPEGLALRAQLTLNYVETSMALYRRVREQSRVALAEAQARGARAVHIIGDGDLADVCRLTCLELGLAVVPDASRSEVAVLEVRGQKVNLLRTVQHRRPCSLRLVGAEAEAIVGVRRFAQGRLPPTAGREKKEGSR